MKRALARLALFCLLAPAALPAQAAPETVLIVDTPSGINRFIRAAHAIRAERGEETRWILRTTRQVDAAPDDSLLAWTASADRAILRLAVGDVARRLGAALDASPRPATVWVYHSDPELMLRGRMGGVPFLKGVEEAALRRLTDARGEPGPGSGPELRAWHLGFRYVGGKGVENAVRLLRFQQTAHHRNSREALRSAPEVAPDAVPEMYPLANGRPLPHDAPSVGILDFDSHALNSEAEIIDSLAAALRRRGMRPVPVVAGWGAATVEAMRRHFFRPDGTPAVQAVISLQSFVLGGDAGRAAADSLLSALDVPVFRAVRLTDLDPDAWRASAEGIPWAAVYHQVAMPEVQGLIEPLVVAAEATAALDPLTGARRGVYAPIPEQVELLAERVGRWTALRRTPAADKRVALVYYNHPPGKQNIGADNLNVSASLVRILELLRAEGLDLGATGDSAWTRDPDALVRELIRRGTNAGAFGSGQRDSLVAAGAVLLPAERYAEWFARLPRLVRREVEDGPLGYLEALLEDHHALLAALPAAPDAEERARLRAAQERLAAEMDLVFAQMRDFFTAFEPGSEERARGPEGLTQAERAARGALEMGRLDRFRAAKRDFLELGIEALSGWGPPPGNVMRVRQGGREMLVIPGVRLGNVWMGPQPQRGFHADPEKVHASTLVSPPHHYLAWYAWLAHEFGADALVHIGRHSSYEWLPRKAVGLSFADHPVALLHGLPSLYLYTVDGVGEGLQAKRRGLATLIDHLTPPIATTELYGELLELQQMHDGWHAQKVPERRRALAERIRARLREPRLADLRHEMEAENGGRSMETFDDELLVHEVGHELGALRETMMPFGLHTFARKWTPEEEGMLAGSMLALRDGVADTAAARAEIVALLRESVRREGEALLRALRGGRVEPGPGNDPIRSPDVLPTGRNFHALDASLIPTRTAADLGRALAERSLAALREERGDPAFVPRRVSAVLWAVETTRDDGSMIGWVLHMLGVRPVWDARGQVKSVERIPLDSLGRARVDVTLVTSGLFRDLFAASLRLVDRAIGLTLAGSAAEIRRERPEVTAMLRGALRDVPESEWGSEPLVHNHLALAWAEEAGERLAAEPAARHDEELAGRLGRLALGRIFGPSPGAYGANINYLVGQPGSWRERADVADHYLDRMRYGYGGGAWGESEGADALERKLRGVEASFHSRSSNLYGVADNDDFFDYFGGLSIAAERVNGSAPDNFVLHSADPRRVEAERLQTFLGRELRARYYNPEWIRGQMGEGYDGARTISNKFVEFLWGWQVTNPDVVRGWMWDEIQDVYLEDRHGLGVDRWLAEGERAHAMQNVAAILLTAAQRGFWQADPERLRRIADRLGRLTAQAGSNCSAHTCGNPEAMAFAERHMDPALRDGFREALQRARGAEARFYQAPQRRTGPARAGVRETAPLTEAAVPAAVPEGPVALRPEPVPPAEPRTRVLEVGRRVREAARSPWSWAAALALALLALAFGAGLRRTDD